MQSFSSMSIFSSLTWHKIEIFFETQTKSWYQFHCTLWKPSSKSQIHPYLFLLLLLLFLSALENKAIFLFRKYPHTRFTKPSFLELNSTYKQLRVLSSYKTSISSLVKTQNSKKGEFWPRVYSCRRSQASIVIKKVKYFWFDLTKKKLFSINTEFKIVICPIGCQPYKIIKFIPPFSCKVVLTIVVLKYF